MKTANTIHITANGKPFSLPAGKSVADFLKEIDFEPGRVVVEKNLEALAPSETGETFLEDGDRLEIVRITAGG